MNRKELQFLARTRLGEAKTLLNAGFPDGAYYLAGYAVECALKACIAKGTRRHDFPDKTRVDASYVHDLKRLIKAAKLVKACSDEAKKDPVFRNHWDLVQQWTEVSRYERHGSQTAHALVEAIGDRRHGVLAWIKRHW